MVLVGVLLCQRVVDAAGEEAGQTSGSAVQIEIKPGSATAEIARKLESAGVIGNDTAFRVYARALGADDQLKPGVYDLTTGMAVSSVVDRLKAGPPVAYVTVTIPEGFVIDQIAERLEKQAGVPKARVLRPREDGGGAVRRRASLSRGRLQGLA